MFVPRDGLVRLGAFDASVVAAALADGVPAAPGMAGTTPAGTTPAAHSSSTSYMRLASGLDATARFLLVSASLNATYSPSTASSPFTPPGMRLPKGARSTTASRLNCSVACGGEVKWRRGERKRVVGEVRGSVGTSRGEMAATTRHADTTSRWGVTFAKGFGSRAKSLRTYRSAFSNDRSALTRRPRDAAYLDEPVRAQVVVHERGHLALRHRAGARRRGLVPARRHRGARRESGSRRRFGRKFPCADAAMFRCRP